MENITDFVNSIFITTNRRHISYKTKNANTRQKKKQFLYCLGSVCFLPSIIICVIHKNIYVCYYSMVFKHKFGTEVFSKSSFFYFFLSYNFFFYFFSSHHKLVQILNSHIIFVVFFFFISNCIE